MFLAVVDIPSSILQDKVITICPRMKWRLCPMVGGHLAQCLVEDDWYASVTTCLYSIKPRAKAGFRTEEKHSSPPFPCSDTLAAIGGVLMFGLFLGSTNLLFSSVNKISQCFKAWERYLMKVANLFLKSSTNERCEGNM